MKKKKIAGSGSRSISQMHGSADPDPDPHQNVMDPEHCFVDINLAIKLPNKTARCLLSLSLLPECGHVNLVLHKDGIVVQQVHLLQDLLHAVHPLYPAQG